MARTLTAAVLADLTAGRVRLVTFVAIQFASGTLRLCDQYQALMWNAQTWTGAGKLLALSQVRETVALQATGITIGVTGIDPAYIALLLGEARVGGLVQAWQGFLTDVGAVVADPALVFSGRLDVPTLQPGPQTMTGSVAAESRMADLNRSRNRRYTAEDQKAEFPGDLGFDFVARIQSWTGQWGNAPTGGTHGGIAFGGIGGGDGGGGGGGGNGGTAQD